MTAAAAPSSSQLAGGVNFTSVSYFDTTGNRARDRAARHHRDLQIHDAAGRAEGHGDRPRRQRHGRVRVARLHLRYQRLSQERDRLERQPDLATPTTATACRPRSSLPRATPSATPPASPMTRHGRRLAHVITTPGLTSTLQLRQRQRHAADPRAGRHDQPPVSPVFDQRPDAAPGP